MGQSMTNETFRRLRFDREWTQEELADRLCYYLEGTTGRRPGIDANWVSRLERGRITWPNKEFRRALRTVLRVATDAELGLFCKRTRRDKAEEVDKSNRREFLSLPMADVFPAPPKRVVITDVDDLADRTYALEEWDRRTGGISTRHLAVGELRQAIEMANASLTPLVRSRLYVAIANLADIAAWTSFDAGLQESSRRIFRLGMRAAKESEDQGIICHVASGLARQEIAANRPDEALALVDMATGDVAVSSLAMLAAVRAQAFALTGDRAQVYKQISLAESIYSRVPDLYSDPRWMWYYTENKLHGDIGDALFYLFAVTRRPVAEVVSQLRRSVDSQTSNRARTKAISSAKLATTLYWQDIGDEADHYAELADELAKIVRSKRLDAAISQMRKARE